MLVFTTIQHDFRKQNRLTCNEYVVCDMVFHLARLNGWCFSKREAMAEDLGVSKQALIPMINRLCEKGFLFKDVTTKNLKTTDKWDEVYGKESLPNPVKKVYPDGKESLPEPGKESLPAHYKVYKDNNDNNIYKETTDQNEISDLKPLDENGEEEPIKQHSSDEGEMISLQAKKEKEKKYSAQKKENVDAAADRVIAYLNEKAGREFKFTESNRKHIRARMGEGFSEKDLCMVVDIKVLKWLNDPDRREYLRPSTLFNSEKCDGYLQEARSAGDLSKERKKGESEIAWLRRTGAYD